eukprot:PLAT10378.1.p2 GENE.PLAT10378.1~~PLAT10378.1.p2  ORF type:complete len:315 (-),score=164.67 PLAT10378.1:95-1039(-)
MDVTLLAVLALLLTVAVWFFRPLLDYSLKQASIPRFTYYASGTEPEPPPALASAAEVSISLVAPAYNEEERLPAMLDETLRYLDHRAGQQPGFTFELLVVDDGSRDETSKVVLHYMARRRDKAVRLLKLEKNQGKGGAVRVGMLHARGKELLMVDADGATKIEDLERLQARLQTGKPDGSIAIGSRAHMVDDAVAERAWYRNILMYGFHMLVTLATASDIQDTQCGFKLFTRAAARRIFPNQHVMRWAFDVELLYLASRLAIPVAEVAVNWTEIPGSKLDLLSSSVTMARDLLLIRISYMLGIWRVQAGRLKGE